ncbi:hypothetical protein [Xanthomonas translucens]|uniref:A coat protein n=2 Tax=Xanthomonas campestris pv. translucens TaxID=343 RepID=A0A109HHB7_XANCT|nr:hypothetical protein [Xanthomonas translucens]KWV12208.1 A coat protein [Xanthomonas translucens]UII62136.1 A coat protein [Xanthomonas translucens]
MRWLARYFARAFVRRVAYLAVALVVAIALQMCSPSAQAQVVDCFSSSRYGVMCADQGEAKAGVYANLVKYKKARNLICWGSESGGTVYGYVTGESDAPVCNGSYAVDFSRQWPTAKTCAARNSTALADAKMWYSAPATCVAGCQIQGEAITQTVGSVTTYGMRNRTYTGQTCTPQTIDANAPISTSDSADKQQDATKPKPPECTALGGGLTACLASNGDHCTTASTGKTFCWTPSEIGKKTDGTDAQVKSKKGDAVTPPDVKIADQDWQRTQGHQQTTCLGSTCLTYNVTNYQSVLAGTAKNGTGDNTADGSGNTSGNGAPGKGTKDGDDDDDGDSASDSGNCTTPPACTGDTLKCLHLKFTWKTQCNTLRSEITKGDGCESGDVPVCAGDSCKVAEYSSLLQQWKQRCAAQALGEGMATRAAGISNGDDAGVVAGIWGGESGGSGLTLRQDLVQVGGGGSLLPDVEIEGSHWTVPQGFYDAIAAVRMVIIAMCTVIAMFVVGRNI